MLCNVMRLNRIAHFSVCITYPIRNLAGREGQGGGGGGVTAPH